MNLFDPVSAIPVLWFIRLDAKSRQSVSDALWIPTLWVGVISSKSISAWPGTGGGDGFSSGGTNFIILEVGIVVDLHPVCLHSLLKVAEDTVTSNRIY